MKHTKTTNLRKIILFLSTIGIVSFLSLAMGCDGKTQKTDSGGGTGTQADENGVVIGSGEKSAVWTTPSAGAFYLRFTAIEGLKLVSKIPNIYQKNNVIEVPFPKGSTKFKVSIKGFSEQLNNQTVTGVKIDNKNIPQFIETTYLPSVEIDLATSKDVEITTASGTTTYTLKAVEKDILEITEITIVGTKLTPKFNQGIFEYSSTYDQTKFQILGRALNVSFFENAEEYKVDNDNWKEFGGNNAPFIILSVGKHKIYFKAKNDPKAPIYLVNLTITN